jgi:imidazole glycerol-phosphate synthase subunit HisH
MARLLENIFRRVINLMIGIVSFGLSNISSIRNALDSLKVRTFLIENPEQVSKAEKILLPGVGSFNEAMKRLKESGLDKALREAASKGIPIMGICLGMQLLADKGYEGGETEGLGLIPGTVKRMNGDVMKLPHMGWNNLKLKQSNSVLSQAFDGIDYYFIHSYEFVADNNENVLATVNHGGQVTAIVSKDNVFGCQFHPEKSQRAGFELLKSFTTNA